MVWKATKGVVVKYNIWVASESTNNKMLNSKVAKELSRNFLKGDMPITGALKFSCQPWFSLMQCIGDK
jgi:hypothetical protein